MKKRFISGLLIICILCGLIPVVSLEAEAMTGSGYASALDIEYSVSNNVHADVSNEYVNTNSDTEIHEPANQYKNGDSDLEAFWLMTVEELVVEAILEGKSEVDLSDYKISTDVKLYNLRYYSPYISNGIDVTCYYRNGHYSGVAIDNQMTLDETKTHFASIYRKLEYIKLLMQAGTSDIDKALILHDYMVHEYEYGQSSQNPWDSFGSGGILMDGMGVCNAYAFLYMYILNHVGIECVVTSSKDMNHAWNIIRIGAEYYHVDVTWDDPVPDGLGKVYHGYFLLSDSAIQTARNSSTKTHYGWDRVDLVCDDASYDEAYWTEITSQVIFMGDNQYYVKYGYITQRNSTNATETKIRDLGIWPVWDSIGGYWLGTFSGLFEYDGDLYFNTQNNINRLSVDKMEESVICTPDTSSGFVYGCALRGNQLVYKLKQSPYDTGEVCFVPQTFSIQAEGILLTESDVMLSVGETYRLTAFLLPEGAETPCYWKSSDSTVASIDDTGLITAVSAGKAVITVSLPNGKYAMCTLTVLHNPFTDVNESQYYYTPILWAVQKGITNGTTATTFSPEEPCTRGQIVTFLWRAFGSPEPKSSNNPFKDVSANLYYYKAVLWAVEQGITTGTSSTTFSPEETCTRGQVATFLWRACGKPTPQSGSNPFSDVSSFVYYYQPILWAVEQGITNGTGGGKFSPEDSCTRGQIVTFLYRALAE